MVKYNNSWGKIDSFIGRRTLNCNPVFSSKYLKSKTRSYNNNVTTISDNADNNNNNNNNDDNNNNNNNNNLPKEGSDCICNSNWFCFQIR